ncbi:hypothetical protein K3495_g12522 [Podosphaera aphanis]|nr:hypothetical protein K3495_g12522 [Podosphaera aphanis]
MEIKIEHKKNEIEMNDVDIKNEVETRNDEMENKMRANDNIEENQSLELDSTVEVKPRYFFRNKKRKDSLDNQEEERKIKNVCRALLAGLMHPLTDDENEDHTAQALMVDFHDTSKGSTELAFPV